MNEGCEIISAIRKSQSKNNPVIAPGIDFSVCKAYTNNGFYVK